MIPWWFGLVLAGLAALVFLWPDPDLYDRSREELDEDSERDRVVVTRMGSGSRRDAPSAAYLRGLAVRLTSDGWEVYSLDTGKADSLHVTEAQARTWARQINVQSGLCCDPLASDAECAVCPDGGL